MIDGRRICCNMTHILRDILKDEIGEQEILALNKCHIFTGEVSSLI